MKTHNKHFEIELLINQDMYLFVESSIRGGLSQISKRFAQVMFMVRRKQLLWLY